MRDAFLGPFGYNTSRMSAGGQRGWNRRTRLNNCYNFGTGRQNSAGGGQGVPGKAGGYKMDVYGDRIKELIKAVIADGAIYLGFDGTDETYPANSGSWQGQSVIHLMAAVCDNYGEYHFYRKLRDSWYEKDGPKNVGKWAKAGNTVPTTKRGFEAAFCKGTLPLAVGYFLILPNHEVNNVRNVYL